MSRCIHLMAAGLVFSPMASFGVNILTGSAAGTFQTNYMDTSLLTPYNELFTTLPALNVDDDYEFSGGSGFAYTISATDSLGNNVAPGISGTPGTPSSSLSAAADTGVLLITFTGSTPVTAVGGQFFNNTGSGSGATFSGTALTLNFSDGTSYTHTPATRATYLGIGSSSALTSISFSANLSGTDFKATVEALRIGKYNGNTTGMVVAGPTPPVPEPAGSALAALSGMMLMARRRRR